jgi:hypothetical protein
LNSRIVNDIIKPFQSRGLWGERDIYKLPFEIPIPLYDGSNIIHREIARITKECTNSANSQLQPLTKKLKIDLSRIRPTDVGRLRNGIRESLDGRLAELDKLICSVIAKTA